MTLSTFHCQASVSCVPADVRADVKHDAVRSKQGFKAHCCTGLVNASEEDALPSLIFGERHEKPPAQKGLRNNLVPLGYFR